VAGLCDAASLRARGWDHVTYAPSRPRSGGAMMRLDVDGRDMLSASRGVAERGRCGSPRVGELSHWKGCAFAKRPATASFAALLAERA